MRQEYGESEADPSIFLSLYIYMPASTSHTVFTNASPKAGKTAIQLTQIFGLSAQDLSLPLYPHRRNHVPDRPALTTGEHPLPPPPGPDAHGDFPSITNTPIH